MRTLVTLSGVCLLVVCATWTYRVNYSTQVAANELADLRSTIASEREAVRVLRSEWAFLNRPDRLSDLTSSRGADLGLVPISPNQFGEIANVAFPLEPEGTDTVLSASTGEP